MYMYTVWITVSAAVAITLLQGNHFTEGCHKVHTVVTFLPMTARGGQVSRCTQGHLATHAAIGRVHGRLYAAKAFVNVAVSNTVHSSMLGRLKTPHVVEQEATPGVLAPVKVFAPCQSSLQSMIIITGTGVSSQSIRYYIRTQVTCGFRVPWGLVQYSWYFALYCYLASAACTQLLCTAELQ